MYKLHIRPEVMRREKMLNLCAVLVPHFKNLRANAPAALHQNQLLLLTILSTYDRIYRSGRRPRDEATRDSS